MVSTFDDYMHAISVYGDEICVEVAIPSQLCVHWNSCLGYLNVHSSTTPNRVFLKLPFEGVTDHPQKTLTSASESLKGVLCKHFHILLGERSEPHTGVFNRDFA